MAVLPLSLLMNTSAQKFAHFDQSNISFASSSIPNQCERELFILKLNYTTISMLLATIETSRRFQRKYIRSFPRSSIWNTILKLETFQLITKSKSKTFFIT